MNAKFSWLRAVVVGLLFIQCWLIAMSVWLIVAGEATVASYFNIAVNIAFGALNVHTLAS